MKYFYWMLLIVFLVSGCNLRFYSTQTDEHHDSRLNTASIERGADLFEQNCASCHGIDGRGNGVQAEYLRKPPANLLKETVQISFKHMKLVITTGHTPTSSLYDKIAYGNEVMPPWKLELVPEEINDIIVYIQHLRKNLPEK